jgi:nucleoside-diphosphate-sugar epimerase
MNVLVAGATGAIGRPLISALVSARHNVFGMTSSELGLQTLKEDGAEGLLASALDAQAVDAAIKRACPWLRDWIVSPCSTWAQVIREEVDGPRESRLNLRLLPTQHA